jgi:predicted ester cyclase
MPTTSSTTVSPHAIAVESMSIMADGDLADFHRLVHPDAVNQEARAEPPACRVPGPDGFHATALWLRAAFSDLQFEVDDVVAEGDLVAVRCTMSGRHTGPFVTYDDAGKVASAMPPTGRTFGVTHSHWLRVRDGQVVEHRANRDDLGQAFQLGWVPPSPWFLLRAACAKRRARRHP